MKIRRWALWWDRVVCSGGHRTIGPVTLFAFGTAMHGGVDIRTRWGFLCFAWPRLGKQTSFGPWLYLSRDGTPGTAWFTLGST